MSFDGIVMRAIALELGQELTGARVDKIYQPSKQEILLHLRQKGGNYRLLLSSSAQEAAIYLTSQARENPSQAPLFCMVLRKHLEGGRIISINQPELERILEITIESYDELGDLVQRQLTVEIMGKHSNIILLDPSTQTIIDSIRRIPLSVSSYRQILPGLTYTPPPPQDKILPWEIGEEEFKSKILNQPLQQKLSKIYLNLFAGFGPQTCAELISRANLEPNLPLEFCGEYELNMLWQAFSTAAQAIQQGVFHPEIIKENERFITYSAIALSNFTSESRQVMSTMNKALDYFYSHRKRSDALQQIKGNLLSTIKKEIERCEKKAVLQSQSILEGERVEEYRLWGELLTANQYQLSPGSEAVVVNYYDPEGASITIPLDDTLSIMDNANYYFKKYQKARNAAKQAAIHLADTQEELEYLQSLLASLDNVTTKVEAEEIKQELQESGYLKAPVVKKKGKTGSSQETSKPSKIIYEGWEIYFGKNNKQNDLLTMKMAQKEDTWLHTKNVPGSHVIIKNPGNKPIPDPVMEAAAILAAYNSKARHSSQVPVDYTLRKHVWKQKGAKPGMVNYNNQHTVYVNPDEELVKNLLVGSLQ